MEEEPGPIAAFMEWGKRLSVRFAMVLAIMAWSWLLIYGGIHAAVWLKALDDGPYEYTFEDQPSVISLGLLLVAWPLLAGATRMARYGWKIRVRSSARFEKALYAHFAADGWSNVRHEGGTLPARGVPFTLAGDHTLFAAIEKVYRGRTSRIMYYGVAPVKGGDPLNRMFTIVAVFTDADSPVTMLYPQRGAAAIKAALGAMDVDTESVEFNRRWRLVSREPRVALEVMQPHVMERLLRDDAQGLTIAWDANAAMALRRGASKDFAALERALDVLVDVADRMPAYQTKSGARGARVSEGSLTVGSPPRYRPGPVEVILGALGLFVAFSSVQIAQRIVPLDARYLEADGDRFGWFFLFACAGFLLVLVAVFIGLARGRRRRRAWASNINAKR